ncbi:MAG: PilZ domain-containing protein [Bryobacteraceae bacterium]
MNPVPEKRREPRKPASGAVRIRFHNPQAQDVDGTLVDVSMGGFRMSHGCGSLKTGSIVEYWHGSTSGKARVMWNRVLGAVVESGFLAL